MSQRLTIKEQEAVLADFAASNGLPAQSALDALDPLDFDQGWRRLFVAGVKAGMHPRNELLPMLSPAERMTLFPADADAQPFAIEECPPLPEEARFDPAVGRHAGGWIDTYARYAQAISPMTPTLFHRSAAFWLVGVAITRRLVVNVGFGPLFPNLSILWVAPTTLFRKSTALAVTREQARKALAHLLLAQDSTPEALLFDLAGRSPSNLDNLPQAERDEFLLARDFAAQKALILDEASGLLVSAGRDYNAGLLEALMRLLDCDPLYRRRTLGRGQLTVRHSYLSFLGATTPQAMGAHLKAGALWNKGWWPRFLILTPEDRRPDWKRPIEVDPLDSRPLTSLYARLPTTQWPEPPPALSVQIDGEVLELWWLYNRAVSHTLLTDDLDHRLFGSYGRLPSFALKVATIMAALDWPETQNKPIVGMSHMVRALSFSERCRASLHRTCRMVAAIDTDALEQRILRQIGRSEPVGATMRDLYRALHLKAHDIENTLCDLENVGLVAKATQQLPGKGKRPTLRYHLVSE